LIATVKQGEIQGLSEVASLKHVCFAVNFRMVRF